MSYPYLPLQGAALELDLAQQLPQALAYYHLALPLAQEDGQLTLVMASPENAKVRALLQQVIGQPIIAVRGDPAEIRAHLDQLYGAPPARPPTQLLAWADDWHLADSIHQTGQALAPLWGPQSRCLDGRGVSLESLMAFTQEGFYRLVLMGLHPDLDLSYALRHSQTSLLLLDGPLPTVGRLLVALQGHSPDQHTLALVSPFGQLLGSQITLLGVASMKRIGIEGIGSLLSASSVAGQHVEQCQQQLQRLGLTGTLKLRQGLPEQEIVREYLEGGYDLLAIAIETHGAFVQRIMHILAQSAPGQPRAVLAVKPTL